MVLKSMVLDGAWGCRWWIQSAFYRWCWLRWCLVVQMVLGGAYGAWWCRWVRPTHFLHMVLKVILYGSAAGALWCRWLIQSATDGVENDGAWWCMMVQMMNPTHSLQRVLNAMVLGGADGAVGADVAGWCRWWVQRTLYRWCWKSYCMVAQIVHNGANVFEVL